MSREVVCRNSSAMKAATLSAVYIGGAVLFVVLLVLFSCGLSDLGVSTVLDLSTAQPEGELAILQYSKRKLVWRNVTYTSPAYRHRRATVCDSRLARGPAAGSQSTAASWSGRCLQQLGRRGCHPGAAGGPP